MSSKQFPLKEFQTAIAAEKKKNALKDFFATFRNQNIKWMFESINVLRNNLISESVQTRQKLNSILAIKYLMEACEHVVIELIEIYLLPEILKVAKYDPDKTSLKRGHTFFQKDNTEHSAQELESLGYNYVIMSTFLILSAPDLKPFRLYNFIQTQDPSLFSLARIQLSELLSEVPTDVKNFSKIKEKRPLYIQRLKEFEDKQFYENYFREINNMFISQIKSNFTTKKELNISHLLANSQLSEAINLSYACEEAILKKKEGLQFIFNTIHFLNLLVESGSYEPRIFFHTCSLVPKLVEDILSISGPNDLSRSQKFLKHLQGTPEQRKLVYCEFLRKLQFWAKTDLSKDLLDESKPSKLALYYELLKNERKIQFPTNPLLKKQLAILNEKKKTKTQSNTYVMQDLQQEELQPAKNQKFIQHMKAPKTWSIVSDSPRSVQGDDNRKYFNNAPPIGSIQQTSMSKQYSKQIPKQSQLQLFLRELQDHKKNKKHTVKSDRAEVVNLKKLISRLTESQAVLPKIMKYITTSNNQILDRLELYGQNEQELDDLMEQSLNIDEYLKTILDPYKSYKKADINYQQFCKQASRALKQSQLSDPDNSTPTPTPTPVQQPQMPETKKKQISHPNIQRQNSKNSSKPPEINIKQPRQSKSSFSSQQQIKATESYPKIAQNQSQPKQESSKSIASLGRQKEEIKHSVKQENKQSKISNKVSIKKERPESKESINIQSRQSIQHQSKTQILQENKQEEHLPQQSRIKQSRVSEKGPSESRVSKGPAQEIKMSHEKINFERSSIASNSKFQSPNKQSENNILENLSIQVSEMKEEIIQFDEGNVRPSMRKINATRGLQSKNHMMMTPQLQKIAENHNSHMKLTSPFSKNKQNQSFILKSGEPLLEQREDILIPDNIDDEDDIIIESPDLQPLTDSFYEIKEEQPKRKRFKSFRQAIKQDTDKDSKIGKKEKLFWLKSETESIMKSANDKNQRSRVSSRISVPEIIEERNKKHQSQMKILEQDRDRKIRELSNKVGQLQRQKSSISIRLKEKEDEIKSLKESSDLSSKMSAQQVNYVDDQNYIMKKLGAHNGLSRRKDDSISAIRNKSYSVLANQGTLVNTKPYQQYLSPFSTEKQRKMHLKNKQILHKDQLLQIGAMGQREGINYKVTCFITPSQDTKLDKVGIENDENLQIKSQNHLQVNIPKNKQQRVHFLVHIKNIPYEIPYAYFYFIIKGQSHKIRVFLPTGFHKFFTIKQVSDRTLHERFTQGPILRGQQIPYSKRALKNMDSIQDYLPHIKKLKDGEPNNMGEIVYGGEAIYDSYSFLLKIFIKPNQFLYVQAVNHKQQKDQFLAKAIEFYLASINHFLMKDITWRG